MEMEIKNERHHKPVQQIQHPFHEQHPLVFVAEQSNEGLKACCDGCGELLSAPCFTCIDCNYRLHKQCAEAPFKIHNHPLHPQHSRGGLLLRQRPYPRVEPRYGCALCKEKHNMFVYECETCYFSLDIKCAKLSSSYKFNQQLKHYIHPHPLTFIESPMAIDVLKRLDCCRCHEPLTDAIYFCLDCPSFIIHKKCLDVELPTKINHPSHHPFHKEHPLVFVAEQSNEGLKAYCDGCGELLSTPCFTCFHCNYHIHKQCAEATLLLPNHPLHPKHSDTGFFLQPRLDPHGDGVGLYGCALCKEKRNMFFYKCNTCSFFLDIKCAQLSSSYKFNQQLKHYIHPHPLTFIESPMAIDVLKRLDCCRCHEPLIDAIYFCLDCPSFIIHKKCLDVELPIKINHPSHHPFHKEHPLVFVAKQSNEGLKAYCDGCRELLSAPRFTCFHCNYHLHKQCAEAPFSLPNHPLHPQHSEDGFFLRRRPHPDDDKVYGCALCKEKRNMFFYKCNACYFSLDIKCAQLSSSYKFNQQPKLDIHQHPLTVIENPMAIDVLIGFNCSWCHEPLTNFISFCFECPKLFILHKKCLDELPTKINHPSLHIHPLFLDHSDHDLFCNLCQKQHLGLFYSCSLCHLNINIGCALPMSIVEDKSRHQHPFTLLRRRGSFICDACDTEGNFVSYICSTCNVMVHKKCTSLSRIIKFSRHNHCIFHKYFLKDLTRQVCKICFKEVKLDRGSYSCKKPYCNYVVHVNCVLEDDNLYKVIEEEKQCEEFSEKSSIIRVIEVNEAGEATKIEHFDHQHCLVLADKMDEEIDRKCDGCMISISTLFYHCSECPFFLHKTCVELPRIKQHWFRQGNATLYFKDFQKCDFCNQCCSGFFYKIEELGNMCLRCAKVADIIECEGHQHFLFFDFKCKENCNGCGNECSRGAFRCEECRFALDFGCLTLPQSAVHKIDEHMLNLTYHDDKKQSYCDICEQERNPSLWYYSCSICDTVAHLKCVLGEFPFLKDGSIVPSYYYSQPSYYYSHNHDLKFVRKVKGYHECSYCGKLCHEEILKCEEPTCNYIIHYKCRWD
ncbi:hypothetical protein J1N35_033103 [Gossypium stocksii]|uniref:Phorbol-ester/DAG-type domain-containing protein n=1 Tax=Gossypium stocksii TaxID=47602 RepID=A0A9D3UPE8_9ROSI|nr:hypothetical protein J1N35_033103 [Gossypium stocksii]